MTTHYRVLKDFSIFPAGLLEKGCEVNEFLFRNEEKDPYEYVKEGYLEVIGTSYLGPGIGYSKYVPVEKENMKKDDMKKKYKVLKEFVSSDGGYVYKEGSKYEPTQSEKRTKNLIRLGYIEEILQKPKTVWDLKEGDEYWDLYADTVSAGEWHDSTMQRRLRDSGCVFLTVKDAEKELARRKAKQVLLRDTKGFKPNWNTVWKKDQQLYSVCCSQGNHKLCISHSNNSILPGIWFNTQEDVEASIEAHEKGWKIYLGVE